MWSTLVVVFLCAVALAVCLAFAFQTAEKRGWVSARAIAAILAAMIVVAVGVWAVWDSFGTGDAGAKVGTGCHTDCAGTAGNAGSR